MGADSGLTRALISGDRRKPCTNCVNTDAECVTPTSGRSPAKSLRRSGLQGRLTERVAAVEEVVQSLGRFGSGMGQVTTAEHAHGGNEAQPFRNRSVVPMPSDKVGNPSSLGEAHRSPGASHGAPPSARSASYSQTSTGGDFEKLFAGAGGGRYVNSCLLGVLDREVCSCPSNL